jgi:hypothetical protein
MGVLPRRDAWASRPMYRMWWRSWHRTPAGGWRELGGRDGEVR